MIYRPNSTMTIGELIDELEAEIRVSGVSRDTPIFIKVDNARWSTAALRVTQVPETPNGGTALIEADGDEVVLFAPHV